MSYNVVFGPRAEEDFRNIGDPVLQSHVLDELDKLAADPVGLSARGSFPHLFGQKYQFWSADRAVHFTVLFMFKDDNTIYILDIGVVRYGSSP